MLSCEFCEIFKDTFFNEKPLGVTRALIFLRHSAMSQKYYKNYKEAATRGVLEKSCS